MIEGSWFPPGAFKRFKEKFYPNDYIIAISAIHSRIESIIKQIGAFGVPKDQWQFRHLLEHVNCTPRSYHIELGQNDRDGEVVIFSRYCNCFAGVLSLTLTRKIFESDERLNEWLKDRVSEYVNEEAREKDRRREAYLELKKEFDGEVRKA